MVPWVGRWAGSVGGGDNSRPGSALGAGLKVSSTSLPLSGAWARPNDATVNATAASGREVEVRLEGDEEACRLAARHHTMVEGER